MKHNIGDRVIILIVDPEYSRTVNTIYTIRKIYGDEIYLTPGYYFTLKTDHNICTVQHLLDRKIP